MSESDDKKKAHEREVLENALRLAHSRGGEARRNADRLSGEIDSSGERPDLVVRAPGGRIVGIEHFRVDHFARHDKKVQSAVAPFAAKSAKRLSRFSPQVMSGAFPNEMLRAFGEVCSTTIKISKDACMDDLVRSLRTRLFDQGGHAQKLEIYRNNLIGNKAVDKVELGYLIEIHSDFSYLYYHDGTSIYSVKPGQCPMFEEAFDLLHEASQDIDWIILAFYQAFGMEMVDAAIVNCRNGMFRESMIRQGLKSAKYLGLGKHEPRNRQKHTGRVEVAHKANDTYTFYVEDTSDDINPNELFENSLKDGSEALRLAKVRAPFACTTSVEIIYELLHDYAFRANELITPENVWHALSEMDPTVRNAKMKNFSKQWNIEDVS